MRGVITGRDVVHHLPLIWREFGFTCVMRCLTALVTRRDSTFLELAMRKASR